MHEDDRDQQVDDVRTPLTGQEQTAQQAVARMLANPRRVRRA